MIIVVVIIHLHVPPPPTNQFINQSIVTINHFRSLRVCMCSLLEVAVGLLGDDFGAVSRAAQQALVSYPDQQGLQGLLQENMHALCTRMPRIIRGEGEIFRSSQVYLS